MITRVGPPDRAELLRLLDEDPVQNVYLAGLCEAGPPRGDLVAYRDGGVLRGVLFIGANVVMYAQRPRRSAGWRAALDAFAAYAVGRDLAGRIIVGERDTIDTFHATYARRGRPARWSHAQLVFEASAGELLAEREPELRRATLKELDAVVAAEAELVRHELGIDPHQRDLATFSARVAERIARGHVFCRFDASGQVLFKADISCRTAKVVQIGGVYTAPAARRRGLARRGLSETCARIFAAEDPPPRLMLYVNDFNTPAIRLYEQLGWRHTFDYRSILVEE